LTGKTHYYIIQKITANTIGLNLNQWAMACDDVAVYNFSDISEY